MYYPGNWWAGTFSYFQINHAVHVRILQWLAEKVLSLYPRQRWRSQSNGDFHHHHSSLNCYVSLALLNFYVNYGTLTPICFIFKTINISILALLYIILRDKATMVPFILNSKILNWYGLVFPVFTFTYKIRILL